METFPCKEPNCDQFVQFNGIVKIPGNFSFTKSWGNNILTLSFKPITEHQESVKGSFVILPNNLLEDKMEFFFSLDDTHQDIMENFYLTCPKGHTHPYAILIKNE